MQKVKKLTAGDLANKQFERDMEEASYKVRTYAGRWFWKGFGVTVDKHEVNDVVRATEVKLQRDSMGLGIILYPVLSMSDEEYNRVKVIEGTDSWYYDHYDDIPEYIEKDDDGDYDVEDEEYYGESYE